LIDLATDFLIDFSNKTSPDAPCQAVNVDESIYEITFFMGAFFSLIYFVNGLVINKVGKKNLLALWFVLCGAAGAAIPWVTDYNTILGLMVVFLTCGVCGSLLSAILVDLFPTNVRAMSLCIVLMIGRFGAVAGSNFVSVMIVTQCELMFGLFGGLLLASAIISILLPGN
jgi:MFS transporter, VNT family, synaptic vesicle glycoprotein 2